MENFKNREFDVSKVEKIRIKYVKKKVSTFYIMLRRQTICYVKTNWNSESMNTCEKTSILINDDIKIDWQRSLVISLLTFIAYEPF